MPIRYDIFNPFVNRSVNPLPPPSSGSPSLSQPAPLSQAGFDAAQLADQPRLPWAWAPHGKANEVYTPVVSGKWWSRSERELAALGQEKRRDWAHIGRIMETELGEKLEGSGRCTACQQRGEECWVYSKKGAQQVSRPGSTCARCRVAARKGGCSVSTRKPSAPRSPPPPGPRSLAAYKSLGGPPPGAGGSAVAV